jgi:hypothetical protein
METKRKTKSKINSKVTVVTPKNQKIVISPTLKTGERVQVYSSNYMVNPKEIHIVENQRGKENGFDQKRVDNIKAKLIAGIFIWDMSTVKVIYKRNGGKRLQLICIDGAHRTIAVIQLIDEKLLPADYKIPFTIIRNKKLEGLSKKNLMSFIADMNNYDPRWKESEHFGAANSVGYSTALAIETILNDYHENQIEFLNSNGRAIKIALKKNVILSLAIRNFIDRRVNYNDFKDDNVGSYMNSTMFNNDLNSLLGLIECVKEWNNVGVVTAKVIKCVLKKIYNTDSVTTVNFEKLVEKLKTTNIKPPRHQNQLNMFFNKLILE